MFPSVASAPKPTQECETHTVWQWSYGSSLCRYSVAIKEQIPQLPTRTHGVAWDFGEHCGSTPHVAPQLVLSRERKPRESSWLKAGMVSNLRFLIRVF
jgi:hypothetical protein